MRTEQEIRGWIVVKGILIKERKLEDGGSSFTDWHYDSLIHQLEDFLAFLDGPEKEKQKEDK